MKTAIETLENKLRLLATGGDHPDILRRRGELMAALDILRNPARASFTSAASLARSGPRFHRLGSSAVLLLDCVLAANLSQSGKITVNFHGGSVLCFELEGEAPKAFEVLAAALMPPAYPERPATPWPAEDQPVTVTPLSDTAAANFPPPLSSDIVAVAVPPATPATPPQSPEASK